MQLVTHMWAELMLKQSVLVVGCRELQQQARYWPALAVGWTTSPACSQRITCYISGPLSPRNIIITALKGTDEAEAKLSLALKCESGPKIRHSSWVWVCRRWHRGGATCSPSCAHPQLAVLSEFLSSSAAEATLVEVETSLHPAGEAPGGTSKFKSPPLRVCMFGPVHLC